MIYFFKVAAIQAKVTKQQQETEEDLAKAEPALQAANTALNTLNRVKHLHTHEESSSRSPHLIFLFYLMSLALFFVSIVRTNML